MAGRQQYGWEMLRAARRARGMTQSEVARAVGCTQSAVSMYETGHEDALADEKVQALAELLDVALPQAGSGGSRRAYCPNLACPAGVPYEVEERVAIVPLVVETGAGERVRCTVCSEFLQSVCPNRDCGAPLGEGAHCMRCGTSYVASPPREGEYTSEWVRRRRTEALMLRRIVQESFAGTSALRPESEPSGGESQERKVTS